MYEYFLAFRKKCSENKNNHQEEKKRWFFPLPGIINILHFVLINSGNQSKDLGPYPAITTCWHSYYLFPSYIAFIITVILTNSLCKLIAFTTLVILTSAQVIVTSFWKDPVGALPSALLSAHKRGTGGSGRSSDKATRAIPLQRQERHGDSGYGGKSGCLVLNHLGAGPLRIWWMLFLEKEEYTATWKKGKKLFHSFVKHVPSISRQQGPFLHHRHLDGWSWAANLTTMGSAATKVHAAGVRGHADGPGRHRTEPRKCGQWGPG